MKQLFYWLIGDRTARDMVYWLMGDRAGRSLISVWNWLWGMPIESGGKISVEAAQESLYTMQESVQRLTEAVAQMAASHEKAKAKLHSKTQEFQSLQEQAALAQQQGHAEAARLAMGKALLIEQVLPSLSAHVSQAEQILTMHRERLLREQQRLETYRMELRNLKDLSEVNDALAAITRLDSSLQVDSARSQFETAQSAVQRRYLKTSALAELSESSAEKLTADLEKLTLDDEITQRLQQLSPTIESLENSP